MRKKFCSRKMFSAWFIGSMLVLSCCQSKVQASQKEYDFAVIYTEEYKNSSKIEFVSAEKTSIETYAYANLSLPNSRAYYEDGKVYLSAPGNSDELDDSIILSYDLSSGEIEEYKFDRVNITDFRIDGEEITISSNLNWEFYLDKYHIQTQEMSSVKTDLMILSFMNYEDICYAIGENMDSGETFLCKFDYQTGECENIYPLSEKSCEGYYDLLIYNQKLYLLFEQNLYAYDINTGEMLEKELERNSPYQLRIFEKELYLVYSDPLSDLVESNGMERVDSGTLETSKVFDYEGELFQVEMKGDRVYILNYDYVETYVWKDQKLHFKQKCELDLSGNYYCGGIFVK